MGGFSPNPLLFPPPPPIPVPAPSAQAQPTGFTIKVGTLTSDAINNACLVCQSEGGGTIELGPGVYVFDSSVVPYANTRIKGTGWGTQFTPQPSFTGDMIAVNQNPTGYLYGFGLEDVYIHQAWLPGVNGIHLTATYDAEISRVWLRYGAGNYLTLDGNATYIGAYSHLRDVKITDGTSTAIGLQDTYHEYWDWYGGICAWFQQSGAIGVELSSDNQTIFGVTFDACYEAFFSHFAHSSHIIHCRFDRCYGTTFMTMQGPTQNMIEGCKFLSYAGTAGSGRSPIAFTANSYYKNVIKGCIKDSGSMTNWDDFSIEATVVAAGANQYLYNDTEGLAIVGNADTAPNVVGSF